MLRQIQRAALLDGKDVRALVVAEKGARAHWAFVLARDALPGSCSSLARWRIILPTGGTILFACVRDLNDAYRLAGHQYTHLAFTDMLAHTQAGQFLRSLVRTPNPHIQTMIGDWDHGPQRTPNRTAA